MDGMKRIYLAAALIVASGAGIGLLLRPAPANSAVSTPEAAKTDDAKKVQYASPGYSGPGLRNLLPPALNFAAANRPDCFYMRVAYANATNPGGDANEAVRIRKAGADSGCWMAGE